VARRPSLPQALEQLIAKLEPELAGVILDALQALRDGVDLTALQDALERNDIEAAIVALDISPADFNQYTLARMSAYAEAGALEAAYIPTDEAASVRFTFDMSNPRAERWIRTQAAERITGYTTEQVEVAREVINEGYARGDGPQQIALDLAGRIDRSTGRRAGGIIGLSEPQAEYVRSMRTRLLSGNPEEMRKVLSGMSLRDHRYDALIQRHIEAGTPLDRADVDKLTGRYADRLLRRRGEDIARTETAQGVMGARREAYAQALDKEGLPPDAITKRWRHLGGLKDARELHLIMAGKEVVGLDTPFVLPDGTMMQHSHDPAGGVKHNANCRCSTDFDIDFLAAIP
jgi:hypothetical protein